MLGLHLPDGPLDVLCLGAHPDDIEIGCGGTLLRLATRPGLRLTTMVLTGTSDRVAESTAALEEILPAVKTHFPGLLDGRLPDHWNAVKDALEGLARECRPGLVLAPRTDDAHQDHRLVGTLVPTVWRDALVLHYEIPKWDGDVSAPTHYVPLDDTTARAKVDLLNRSFPSQHAHDWWDDELFLGLMRVRGMECRSRYAEAYHTHKVLVDLDLTQECS
ncbi:PIG-L deacetylase family protein [Nocardioides sp. DS6]|uniref:PIG-L deacetylase family protein n=1 Tax=Nocardioides eburneus TaxID=3231482 RepID=A0ABV3T5K8_9ACTN